MPRFHVRDAFPVNDKCLFVMAGFVIEGHLLDGMLVRLPFQTNVMMTAEIDHIQHLHRPDGDIVCLCIRCRDTMELALWDALKIKDRTIDVIPAGTTPADSAV
jgi:hypothetical protein